MSTDHQDTQPPITTGELHPQPSSTTVGNNNLRLTKSHPHSPSPMISTDLNSVSTNSTPESRIAAAFGRAFFNIPPISFQEAANTTNTLLRTLSDADSSANQTTTVTPPTVPKQSPLRRSLSDTITTDYEQTQKTNKTPIRRLLNDTSDYQQPRKTPRVSSSPQSSAGKQSPQSERLRKMQDMVKEIEQRCREIMSEEEKIEEDKDTNPLFQEQDECVGVERLTNGDLRFELSCSCGKNFEMLIKHNGYCFYRLT